MSDAPQRPSSSDPSPQFTPRISSVAGPAPFDPSKYFWVAFLGGVIAVAVVAFMNLPRLAAVRGLATRTKLAIAGLGIAALVFLVVAPDDFWTQQSRIRLGLRIVAVAGSVLLYRLHKGPAVGGVQRHADYMSMWKAVWPIVGAAIAQGILTVVIREVVQ